MRFRPKSLNATKKSFETRVTLLSRYSFLPKYGLPKMWAYPLIHTPLDAKSRYSSVMTAAWRRTGRAEDMQSGNRQYYNDISPQICSPVNENFVADHVIIGRTGLYAKDENRPKGMKI